MDIAIEKTVTTSYQINNHDLVEMLEKQLDIELPRGDCAVFVKVPGGGDWSNMELDINDENTIIVQVTEHICE